MIRYCPSPARTRALLLALLSTALSACTSSPTTLDAQALRSQIIGQPFSYTGGPGGGILSGELTLRTDGSIAVTTTSGQEDGGRWRLDGDRICSTVLALRRGQTTCFSVTQTGFARYDTSHGFTLRTL